MDFSCPDVSPTKVTSSPSPVKSTSILKNITVPIQLFVAAMDSELECNSTHWPLAIAVGNSFSLKKFLEIGAKFPKDLGTLKCNAKIMYPDRIRREMREISFSEIILNEFPFDELTRLPWLGHQVTTFVTDRCAETVMEAFEMIKSLNLVDITNPVDEKVKIHIKVLPTLEIKPVDLPVMKYLVKQITEANSDSTSGSSKDIGSSSSSFVIAGTKRQPDSESHASSASSKPSKSTKK